ncbi:MAG: MarR family transcriptional regulator [Sulfolobaceae archaeon]|nr:MarR family transcriptional regulator [Sulfolobaceae archaeon]
MNLRDKILAFLYKHPEVTAKDIAAGINEDEDYVLATLNTMVKEKLVTKRVKGMIFKKEVYSLTPTGLDEAQEIYNKLQNVAVQLRNMINPYNLSVDQIPEEFMDLIPLLVSLSLLDMLFLSLLPFGIFIMGGENHKT